MTMYECMNFMSFSRTYTCGFPVFETGPSEGERCGLIHSFILEEWE